MSMTLVAAAVTPIANGGTGATTVAGARKNLGIATVADKPVTDLYNGGDDGYVRWSCRNGVVTITWSVKQATTNQWKAGSVGSKYAPLVLGNGNLTVACWAPNGKTATAWIDARGDLYLQCAVAQENGRNVGSMTYIAHGDGTVNPGGGTVMGVEYTAGEGIWIKDHVIGADVTQAALDGKAAVGHKHAIADVDGLQAELDGKAAVGHTHAMTVSTTVTDGDLNINIG